MLTQWCNKCERPVVPGHFWADGTCHNEPEPGAKSILERRALTPAEKTIASKKGKPRWGLMPFGALTEVVKVLTWGAEKHVDHGWRDIPNAKDVYFDALMRHIAAYHSGVTKDEESGLPTLAHAACDAIILLAITLSEKP